MTAHLGAHEVMELHEVLTDTIDGINQFRAPGMGVGYRVEVPNDEGSSSR